MCRFEPQWESSKTIENGDVLERHSIALMIDRHSFIHFVFFFFSILWKEEWIINDIRYSVIIIEYYRVIMIVQIKYY